MSSRSSKQPRLRLETSQSSRPGAHLKHSVFTRPLQYQHECKTGKHKFLSSICDVAIAQCYHNRTCPDLVANQDGVAPTIATIDYDPHYPNDIHHLMFEENADGELIDEDDDLGHVDYIAIGLDPDLNYGLVEINEAINFTVDQYDELEDPSRARIFNPPSTIFVHLQTHIEELYSIDCFKDTMKFQLRYGVMWQDVLSLSNFSLKNSISQSTGMELIELIHEIMRRHGCDSIPLHRQWRSVEKCIGRKIQPTNLVRLAVIYIFKSRLAYQTS